MTGNRFRLSVALLIVATGAAALGPVASPASAAACPGEDTPALLNLWSLPQFEDSVLCVLNEQRTSRGLAPLAPNAALGAAAETHSLRMKQNQYFSHDSPDGSPFSARIAAAGYLRGARTWLVGENIGWGSSLLGTPRSLTSAWMASPEHRHNILEADFEEIGLGAQWGSPSNPNLLGAVIVTTDFGTVTRDSAGGANRKKKGKKKRRKRRRRTRGR